MVQAAWKIKKRLLPVFVLATRVLNESKHFGLCAQQRQQQQLKNSEFGILVLVCSMQRLVMHVVYLATQVFEISSKVRCACFREL